MRSKFSALAVASIALPALWPAPCAAGEPHWAYVAPRRPAPPEVRRPGWAANPIDRFVLARLEREGLTPSPPADKARLLRRVHLDLTGLPPTPEQVDTFLADDRPDAYERVVEGLLASPAYGERWARPWLDAARHADSNGFQRDGFREVWPYRDWVVAAMNADVPFDRFTVEQIAGDLLPGADLGQKIATGFHRGTPVNVEAGVDQEENRVLAVIDRVNTTATVWLGTTMACAQCHDHKYDPFDQRDYYRLFAFFNNTPLETEGGEKARREFTGPKLTLPMPPERERRRREFAARREQLAAELGALRKEADAARPAWEEAARADAEGLKKLPAAVRRALALAPQKRNAKQREAVADYHLGLQPGAKELQEKLAALDKELDGLRPDTTLVMQEMPEPRATHVFKRGDFLSPGEKVEPGVPAALHPFPEGAPRNRLGLARWLTDRRNPLTARVTVNRWWAEFFGRGLVETPEDFGTQGAPPTHPGLLDWLAVEFMDCGWSRKHVHRLIVTSATYRQSSRASPELWKRDPANALLARGPRFRLPAEAVRDNALAVAGLLSRKMGGPPVKPPQPPGVWNVTGMVDNTYRVSAGEDRYRRGLYTIWRRSAPYPSFVAFDAPDRSSCVVQRPRTNTPLQALALMNGEVYVEAARAFARRVLAECGGGEREQVAWAFRACLARPPTSEEVHILAEVYGRELARFRTDPGAARALIGPGECPDGVEAARLAALFHVTTILLNLDETITKG